MPVRFGMKWTTGNQNGDIMRSNVGYQWLIDAYQLPVVGLKRSCIVDTAARGRTEKDYGSQWLAVFESRYQPEETLAGHLQFALRYEGVNLQALCLLFEQCNPNELCEWLIDSPTSGYARRAGFFYEWLTGNTLPIEEPVPAKTRYIDALDTDMQFGGGVIQRNTRFRVVDNLPGTPAFCPLVRKTEYLAGMVAKDLKQRTQDTLQHYDPDLLRRAAAFLYLKETQSSFEVEREKPSADRAQRFADLLKQADTGLPLDENRFVELQNAIIDPRFHEYTWRSEQNWIGKDWGYRQQIDFVPPRPEDVQSLMAGLQETAQKARLLNFVQSMSEKVVDKPSQGVMQDKWDPVVYAAIVAFGFVFIHPFMDGNGRIHRYLIHDVLSNAGFTPRGIVLPVSAVILANLDEYIQVLEAFSNPVRQRTEYAPDLPGSQATGNDAVYFRYFDATEQAEFLYKALERTVEVDLQQEIDFLLGFDLAQKKLNPMLDWPPHSLELFIRVVHQNGGELSKSKRKSHFQWMTDAEVTAAEALVTEAFAQFH